MATYHLNVRKVSKAKGQSAKAKSDYINRADKYSARFEDLRFSESGNMPKFAEQDPKSFWVCADLYERANARVCTEIEFALPRELTLEQNQELVRSFINNTINNENHKLPYSFAIHNDSENHNPHCHLIFSERHNDQIERSAEQFFKRANSKNAELGGAKKSTHANSREFVQEVRTTWRKLANEHLEKNGHAARIDERTLEEQGVVREASRRLDRIEWREVKALEKQIEQLEQEITSTEKAITQEKSSEENEVKKFLTQEEFDQFLIDNWLAVDTEITRANEKLSDFEKSFKEHVSDLNRIQAEYDKLDEKNQGFLGLWESKEQKQRKKELADEFEKVAQLRNKARDNYKKLKSKLEQFEQNKLEPVRKRIEQIQTQNPELKMRKANQLRSMQFKGLSEWHKESRQRKLEWERFEKNRQRERELERKKGLSL